MKIHDKMSPSAKIIKVVDENDEIANSNEV
jgi:hypothetical protein